MRRAHFTLTLTFLVFVAVGVRADGWDDFANNLATDLAPLLSLFGEQVTKQYLSESLNSLDIFILAVAPLGILTVVVSAIRVCGKASLRAFIGRAQEGVGNAEAELCSSTSRDVCELYHNGGIARVFGRPKILEIIHDKHATDFYTNGDDDKMPKCGIHLFRDYLDTDSSQEEWKDTAKSGEPDDSGEGKPEDKSAHHFAPNPNLSLNVGIKKQSQYIAQAAAAVGFLAQSSVFVVAIVVTYVLGLEKDGKPMLPWACPMTILGSLMLCAGMFLCANLVERSTKERVFQRKDEPNRSTFFWIQPGNQIIGDQTFDAFAYTDSDVPLKRYITSWKVPPVDSKASDLKVWISVGVTMCGFVLQFVGLRAMHSVVSVSQLGAICLMSVIRAGLRTRRLEKEDNDLRDRLDKVPGHELDWLAFEIGKRQLLFQFPETADKLGLGREVPREGARNIRVIWSLIPIISPSHGSTEDGKRDDQPVMCGFKFKKCASNVKLTQADRSEAIQRSLSTARQSVRAYASNPSSPRLGAILMGYRARLAEMTSSAIKGSSQSSQAWNDDMVRVRKHSRQLSSAMQATIRIISLEMEKVDERWKDMKSFFWPVDISLGLERKITESMEKLCHDRNVARFPPHHEQAKRHNFQFKRLELAPSVQIPTGNVPGHDKPVDGKTEIIERLFVPFRKPDSGLWRVELPYLEAVLGLSVWSLVDDAAVEKEDDHTGLKVSRAAEVPSKRIVAIADTEGQLNVAQRELSLWMHNVHQSLPVHFPEITLQQHSPLSLWKIENENGKGKVTKSTGIIEEAPMARFFGWQGSMCPEREGGHTERQLIYATSDASITKNCALDIYQRFLYALTLMIHRITGETTTRKGTEGLGLENTVITSLYGAFRESGLGSEEDATSTIIPVLKASGCLPSVEDVLSVVRQEAESLEPEEAEERLKWSHEKLVELPDGPEKEKQLEKSTIALGELYRKELQNHDRDTRRKEERKRFGSYGISQMSRLNTCPLVVDMYKQILEKSNGPIEPRMFLNLVKSDTRVDALVLFGSDVDTSTQDYHGRTALSWAAQHGCLEVVKSILAIGTQVDKEDEQQRTPLSYAAEHGHIEVVQELINARAVKVLRDKAGRTPLSYAAGGGHIDVMETIVEDQRERLSTKDNKDQSPLHWAASQGHYEAVKWLLKREAEIDAPDQDGKTPLIHAMIRDHTDIIGMLIQKRARTDIRIGDSPVIEWAMREGEWKCAKSLLEADQQNQQKLVVLFGKAAQQSKEGDQLRQIIKLKKQDIWKNIIIPIGCDMDIEDTKGTMMNIADGQACHICSTIVSRTGDGGIKCSEIIDLNNQERFLELALNWSNRSVKHPDPLKLLKKAARSRGGGQGDQGYP